MKEELIKSALLGTDKFFPSIDRFDGTTMQKAISINNKPEALLTAYFIQQRREYAGQMAEKRDFQFQTYIESSAINYISAPLEALFQSALLEKDDQYVQYLTALCEKQSLTLTHKLVPAYSLFAKQTRMSAAICGPFYNWLQYAIGESEYAYEPQFDFSTASATDRLNYLKTQRISNPDAARELMLTDFDKEKSEVREQWIQTLAINLQGNDVQFLIQNLDDKSKKVRALSQDLLCLQFDNPIAQKLINYIQLFLSKEEKSGFLGLKKITKLILQKVPLPADLKKEFSLQDLSPDKNIPDDVYLLGQLLQKFEIRKLAALYQLSPQVMLESLFDLHPAMGGFLESHFERIDEPELLYHAFKEGIISNVNLLAALPLSQSETFFEKFMVVDLNALARVITLIVSQPYFDLKASTAKLLIKKISESAYINAPIKRLGYFLPVECLNDIVKLQDQPNITGTTNLRHLQIALVQKSNVKNLYL